MFANYRKLLNKIDSFVAGVMVRHPASFKCAPGCSKCCVAGITVWRVEADHIQEYLSSLDKRVMSSSGDRCAFLDDEGRCSIYQARPVVCRIWGAPLLIPAGSESDWAIRDHTVSGEKEGLVISCDLNFTGIELIEELPDTELLNTKTAITALAAVNHVYCRENGLDPEERIPLGHLTQDLP